MLETGCQLREYCGPTPFGVDVRVRMDDFVMVRYPGMDWEILDKEEHSALWQWLKENWSNEPAP